MVCKKPGNRDNLKILSIHTIRKCKVNFVDGNFKDIFYSECEFLLLATQFSCLKLVLYK